MIADIESREHPGIVEIVDGDTGEVLDRADAGSMPFEARFERTERGLVPIVKVVITERGDQRTLTMYGPNGEWLRSITQTAE